MTIHKDVIKIKSLEFSSVAKKKSLSNNLISLGLGEPHLNTPKEIIDKAYHYMNEGFTKYSNPYGEPILRNKLSEKYDCDEEQVIINLGSKQALSLSLQSILEDKDEIIIIEPCYVSYLPQILLSNHNVKVVKINLDENLKINFKTLQSLITTKTKALLINFPNNPSGAILCDDDVEKIFNITKKNDIYLISDEIYTSLKLNTVSECPNFKKYVSDNNKVIILDGFSKKFAMTGWRLGFTLSSKKIINRIAKIQQHLNTCVPSFIQLSIIDYINNEFYAPLVDDMSKNEFSLANILKNNENFEYTRTSHGMFAFVKVKHCEDTDDFCSRFVEKELVAVTPGKLFGDCWSSFIRISFACEPKKFNEGINKLVKFYEKYISN